MNTNANTEVAHSRTMQAWMQAHHGVLVDTVQTKLSDDTEWSPKARLVDSRSHMTYVSLGGSIRDYSGCVVQGMTPDSLTVMDKHHFITYTVS